MSIFDRSTKKKLETSVHNLSHSYDGTYWPGTIYPILCTKVVPGDVFQIASSPILRSQPFISPLMTNVKVDIRYFYCRNLLLWENFDQYITNSHKFGKGSFVPGNDPAPVHPYFTFQVNDLSSAQQEFFDYLYGVKVHPSGDAYVEGLDALPARLYNLIYNEYYYNQYYSKDAPWNVGDGADDPENYILKQACYAKDYFTSALPSPQRGEAVAMDASVVVRKDGNGLFKSVEHDPEVSGLPGIQVDFSIPSTDPDFGALNIADGSEYGYYDPNGTLGVTIDINDIRKASAIQRFLELSAVSGNRYAELILAHFGIKTPDNSAFRPQYLGGGSAFVNFSAVEQNSQTDETPQGTLAGKGTVRGVVGMNHPYLFTEHGWLMALMVIRPDAMYAGGVNRQYWVGDDRFDGYYWPGLQNIGMQAIKRRELALQVADVGDVPNGSNMQDIAYTDRYMEYKNIPSTAHGEFTETMKQWVAIRDFIGAQQAGIDYQVVEVPNDCFDDNVAVSDYPPFFGGVYHHVIARRPMQYHARYGSTV